MNKRRLIEIVLVLCIFGCQCGCDDAVSSRVRKIRRDAETYRDVLAAGTEEYSALERQVVEQIESIPDDDLRQKCYSELKALVFSIDLRKVADDPDRVVKCLTGMRDLSNLLLAGRVGRTKQEQWRNKMQYLKWLREQTRQLEEDVLGSLQPLNGRVGALRSYDFCAVSYEMGVMWCEKVVPKSLPDELARAEVMKMFEQFLGRRLRTKAECNADWKVKRRLEFPYLVPTPDGIQKKWTKEEK